MVVKNGDFPPVESLKKNHPQVTKDKDLIPFIYFLEEFVSQMLRLYGIFTYMKGEKWRSIQGEMAW